MLNSDCGIYSITVPSGMVYFGQAQSFRQRWGAHLKMLRRGAHPARKLQDAFNQFGEKSLVFAKIAFVPVRDLNWREQEQIDACPKDKRINRCRVGSQARRGEEVTPETRERLAKAARGKTFSDEHKARMAASLTGAGNPGSKSVICIESGQVFESVRTAAQHLRMNGAPKAGHAQISQACNGKAKSAYGYTWRYMDERT